VADCKMPPISIRDEKFDLILFIGSRVIDFACYSSEDVVATLESYCRLLTENAVILVYELTDFSGMIEPNAGWHFKTFNEMAKSCCV